MSLLKELIIKSDKTLDRSQAEILQVLEQLLGILNEKSIFLRLKNRLFNKFVCYRGIYLHGSFGGGKTLLMKNFFKSFNGNKKLFHYQELMKYVHEQLASFKQHSKQDKIYHLTKSLTENYSVKLICIDEFEILDITDAMIIMSLFKFLIQKNIFIFITNNIQVEELYLNGIQRESFLSFIDILKEKFLILELKNLFDYRKLMAKKSLKNTIIYPINKYTNKIFDTIISNMQIPFFQKFDIKLFNRKLNFKCTYKNFLFTNFSELFERDIGYADYVSLTKNFNVIFVKNIRVVKEYEKNVIIRLINFIDNAYFNNVILFAIFETEPINIYSEGLFLKEFQRAVSRLHEMNARA